MAKELITPNWHVALIHFPLGVFALGMLLELGCLFLRHHSSVRSAARWMVVFGALAGLPAAYAGAYAMSDVVRRSAPTVPADAPWHVVESASPLTAEQWEVLGSHVWTSGGITVIAALLVTLAVACTDRWRQRLYPVFFVLLLGCLVYMGVGAHQGGTLVYREGIAVKMSDVTQADESAIAETQPAVAKIAGYVKPLQLHVTLAGVAAAMGLLGIGLSLRAASTSPHWRDPELERAGLHAMPNPQRGGAHDMALLRSFAPRVEVTGEAEYIPAARFWLLVFLVSALASLAGWWTLGTAVGSYKPQDLWAQVTAEGYVRRFVHVVLAASTIVIPLLMSVLARFVRRSHFACCVFGILLVGAVAAQVYIGSLLMFDQPKVGDGQKWYRLQEPTTQPSVVADAR